jgi:hypothetical protein
MRIYTYAQYSTERQTEASIVDQQRRCHQYTQSRGWNIAADFTDEGISGAALGNRPGFQKAMSVLQTGGVLLAADLTRLSRSQELAPLLDRLRFRGVRVVGVLDGFDSEASDRGHRLECAKKRSRHLDLYPHSRVAERVRGCQRAILGNAPSLRPESGHRLRYRPSPTSSLDSNALSVYGVGGQSNR